MAMKTQQQMRAIQDAKKMGYMDALVKAPAYDERFHPGDEKDAYWEGYFEGEEVLKEYYEHERQQINEGILFTF